MPRSFLRSLESIIRVSASPRRRQPQPDPFRSRGADGGPRVPAGVARAASGAYPPGGARRRSGAAQWSLPLAGVSGCLDLSDAADRHTTEPAHRLVERLRSRLGSHAVSGLCLLAEHRPEIAWGYVEPGTTGAGAGNGRRPFWILEEPQRLPEREGRPCLDGRLRMERGPERIETGWCLRPGHLWCARDRRGRWLLHGIFG